MASYATKVKREIARWREAGMIDAATADALSLDVERNGGGTISFGSILSMMAAALFAAAILGGAGSLYGAVLGGMVVGLSENLSVMIIPTTYKPAVPCLLILAILYFRPEGIFGEQKR